MGENLTSRAVKGVQWTTASTAITSVLQIGYTSVMARILDPSAFGLVAIAGIILHLGSFFARLGMSQALIQKAELNEKDIRAVFTSSVLLSSLIVVIVWLISPMFTLFFDKVGEEVVLVAKIMSLTFLTGGMSATAVSLLTRELKFKSLAIQEILSYVIAYFGVGLGMGLMGYGVWSLVYASLSQSFFIVVFAYATTRHSIIPVFRWKYYQSFFKYGSLFSIGSFVDYLGMSLPMILIGKFFGDYKLGIFRQAFMIINVPLTKLAFSVQNVVFPMYSIIQNDEIKLKRAYLSATTIMAAVFIPLGFGISVSSKEITLVLLGEGFIESYPILGILALGVAFRFLSQFTGVIWDAKAFLDKKFYLQGVYLVLLIVVSFVFKDYGLIGFAWIVTISEVIRNFVFMIITGKMLKVSMKEHFNAYFPGFFIGVVCAVVLFIVTLLLDTLSTPVLVKMIVQMVVGGMSLLFLIVVKPLPVLKRLIQENFLKAAFFKTKRGSRIVKLLGYQEA